MKCNNGRWVHLAPDKEWLTHCLLDISQTDHTCLLLILAGNAGRVENRPSRRNTTRTVNTGEDYSGINSKHSSRTRPHSDGDVLSSKGHENSGKLTRDTAPLDEVGEENKSHGGQKR